MPTSHGRSSTLSVALALGTVYIVWGSTYLAIAYVVETLPPIMAGGVRFTVAGSLLLAFLLAQPGGVAAAHPSRASPDRG